MSYEHILYEVADKIATITLNRPDRMNAWTPIMERDVRHAMESAAADDNVRVIVLTGAGRAFCAGADMDALKTLDMFMTRFAHKREHADALWLRVWLLCQRSIDPTCRKAAHTYMEHVPGTPAAAIAERITVTE